MALRQIAPKAAQIVALAGREGPSGLALNDDAQSYRGIGWARRLLASGVSKAADIGIATNALKENSTGQKETDLARWLFSPV